MTKYKALILSTNIEDDHLQWKEACERSAQIEVDVVNLLKSDWFTQIQNKSFDFLLAKPEGINSSLKQLYDERIFILSTELGYKIFPSPKEIYIYENKRFISFWLKANKIPHPKTFVFYSKKEAISFINAYDKKLVAKTNIGASGSGVSVLYNNEEKKDYIIQTFDGMGAPKRVGPNLQKGGLLKRGLKYVFNPKKISSKLKLYKATSNSSQKDFVLFQEFIPHDYEWRVVRVGDSFFAHKKLKLGEKASGSLVKGYDNPPFKLLDFVKEITDKHKFYSQAVDIFESNGDYLVNEMQCIFGQSDSYQMLFNGKMGRYRKINNEWVFEQGDYAKNQCYDLRLEYILKGLI